LTLNYYIVEDWYTNYQSEVIYAIESLMERLKEMKDAAIKEKKQKR